MILLYSGLEFGENASQGVAVTQSALNEHLGSAGGIFLTIAITLFCIFFIVVGNYYYGQSNIEFLSKIERYYLSLDVYCRIRCLLVQ